MYMEHFRSYEFQVLVLTPFFFAEPEKSKTLLLSFVMLSNFLEGILLLSSMEGMERSLIHALQIITGL
jgi:hypothetical protein